MAETVNIFPKEVGAVWKCIACGLRHNVSIYVALHMREGLNHSCACGRKSVVQNWTVAVRDGA